MSASRYGQFYWCVKVPRSISSDGEIYFHANTVEITPAGALVAHGDRRDEHDVLVDHVNLALAPGQWQTVFAASCLVGDPVAVEHWAEPRPVFDPSVCDTLGFPLGLHPDNPTAEINYVAGKGPNAVRKLLRQWWVTNGLNPDDYTEAMLQETLRAYAGMKGNPT